MNEKPKLCLEMVWIDCISVNSSTIWNKKKTNTFGRPHLNWFIERMCETFLMQWCHWLWKDEISCAKFVVKFSLPTLEYDIKVWMGSMLNHCVLELLFLVLNVWYADVCVHSNCSISLKMPLQQYSCEYSFSIVLRSPCFCR